jgi:hypothetical protein
VRVDRGTVVREVPGVVRSLEEEVARLAQDSEFCGGCIVCVVLRVFACFGYGRDK